jgi:hypothetical protein
MDGAAQPLACQQWRYVRGACCFLRSWFISGGRRPPRNQVGNVLSDCTVDLPIVVVLLVITLYVDGVLPLRG